MTPEARAIRFAAIKEVGCLACKRDGFGWTYPEIHHLLSTGLHGNGRRRGDDATIGLCQWHHRGQRDEYCHWAIGPSYSRSARAFRERYGDDHSLLAWQNTLIARHAPMFGGGRA